MDEDIYGWMYLEQSYTNILDKWLEKVEAKQLVGLVQIRMDGSEWIVMKVCGLMDEDKYGNMFGKK